MDTPLFKEGRRSLDLLSLSPLNGKERREMGRKEETNKARIHNNVFPPNHVPPRFKSKGDEVK